MKLNAILGKKQIILSSLVLILGVAVYLNWQFANTSDSFAVNGTVSKVSTADTTSVKNYGDAKLVDNPVSSVESDNDYFTKARLSRSKARSEAAESIKKILNSSNVTSEEKKEASKEAIAITQMTDTEAKVENLIKAKGFDECVVYLEDKTANVILKTSGLESKQAAQVKDIILNETSVKAENIRIVEVE